jgi:hypothetical protein
MSNALAMASVSFVLVDLLNNGLIDRNIASTLGSDITVSAWPPDKVDVLQQDGKSQLNLFLYNVTQNQGWRNAGYPSRDAGGDRINNPPLALDLHYLLSAYGAEQFHAEILLGYGMQLFHETPFLPRDAIRNSLSAPTQVSDTSNSLPTNLVGLFSSGLADQVEQIKIWPQTLSTEEISRLWTAFQAKYRPTAAYQVSVVLIQSQTSIKSALPVRGYTVQANVFAAPVISQVLSISNTVPPVEADQPILPGYSLVLTGNNLQGTAGTSVLIAGEEVDPPAAQISPGRIIASIPADIPAGTQTVQIVQTAAIGKPPSAHRSFSSEPTTFVLHPAISNISLISGTSNVTGLAVEMVKLTVSPAVGSTQTVQLLLNQLPADVVAPALPLAYSFTAEPPYSLSSPPPTPPPPSNTVLVPYVAVTAGRYLVRIQVDGAESLLTPDANGIFNLPQVTF